MSGFRSLSVWHRTPAWLYLWRCVAQTKLSPLIPPVRLAFASRGAQRAAIERARLAEMKRQKMELNADASKRERQQFRARIDRAASRSSATRAAQGEPTTRTALTASVLVLSPCCVSGVPFELHLV